MFFILLKIGVYFFLLTFQGITLRKVQILLKIITAFICLIFPVISVELEPEI